MPERKRKRRADFIVSVSATPSRLWIVAFMLGAVALAGVLALLIGLGTSGQSGRISPF